MGHQGPYRAPDLRMLRYGTIYRHDPNATLPAAFLYEVGDPDYGLESWREGTVLIRNPNARRPLPRGWLGAAAEEDRVGGQVITTFLEPFLPYMSITENFHGADDAFIRRCAEEVKATLLETFPP